MSAVTMDKLTKVYPNGVTAVSELDLEIADGEFLVLVGPSGCGKSTALRMVAGLEEISEGTLLIGERVVNDLPPKERDIAMVFQNYALYPHMTVEQNIGFALKLARLPKDEIRQRVHDAARTLQLEDWLQRKPGQLSGGQRQRVAMGRAIVRDPAVFLMDEPLSNLDAKLRVQMRAEIARLQRELKTTTIYVTHDQVEALTMGDRVAVLRDGTLQQVADPETLYNEPANLFVAAFIGSPAMNLLEATFVEEDDGTARAILDEQSLTVPPEVVADNPGLRDHVGGRVVVGIRPEHIFDAGLHDPRGEVPGARLRAEVELREALGSELVMHLRTAAHRALTDDTRSAADADEAVLEEHERQAETGEALLVARFDARSRARIGDKVELAVDTSQLHFFDPETGLRLSQLPEPDPVEVADPADEVVEGDEVVEVVEVADPADEVAEGDGEETAGTAEA
jgi:multiple sugar transport system ATP-binding protein